MSGRGRRRRMKIRRTHFSLNFYDLYTLQFEGRGSFGNLSLCIFLGMQDEISKA
jgi:hypothetical protein